MTRLGVPSPFGQITDLTLHVDRPAQWAKLLSPTLLPALVHLAVHTPEDDFYHQPFNHHRNKFEKALRPIARQTTSFSCGDQATVEFHTARRTWTRFTALKHLTIAGQHVDSVLEQLPASLYTLEIRCGEYSYSVPPREILRLRRAIELGVASVASLKRVTVEISPLWSVDNDVARELGAVCTERQSQLIFTDWDERW